MSHVFFIWTLFIFLIYLFYIYTIYCCICLNLCIFLVHKIYEKHGFLGPRKPRIKNLAINFVKHLNILTRSWGVV